MNCLTKLILICSLLCQSFHLWAQRGRPHTLSKKEPLEKVCRAIFVHTDDKAMYNRCSDARWYANLSSGTTAVKYTLFSLSVTIGLIGIIPYAQSEDPTVWWVAAGLFAGGLLALIPEAIIDGVAKRKRFNVIIEYNERITSEKDKKVSHLSPALPRQRLSLALVLRF